MAARSRVRFFALNALMWVVMTVLLVLIPDSLEPWIGLEVARMVGWAVACGAWVVVLESAWKSRTGPFARFFLQLGVWVSAALVAAWISDQARMWSG